MFALASGEFTILTSYNLHIRTIFFKMPRTRSQTDAFAPLLEVGIQLGSLTLG